MTLEHAWAEIQSHRTNTIQQSNCSCPCNTRSGLAKDCIEMG